MLLAPSATQDEKERPLLLGAASIVRNVTDQTEPSESFNLTYSIKGLEIATHSTRVSSPSALIGFLTGTLHVDRQVAEETLIKLEQEGRASIEGGK